MKKSNNVHVLVEFKDSDCERFKTDTFSLESGILTIKQDVGVKRTLLLHYIKSIYIF